MLRVGGGQLFRAREIRVRGAHAPLCSGIDGETPRIGIESAKIDIGAVLVRLATVEHRPFELPGAREEAGGDDAERDVRGILPVMRERRQRITGSTRPVWE